MPRSEPDVAPPPIEVERPSRQPFKRSQSSTSIASLPTPPPTRKRKRAGSKLSRASDSDDSDAAVAYDSDEEFFEGRRGESGKDEDSTVAGYKRRRVLTVDAIAEELSRKSAAEAAEEDAFWGMPTSKEAAPSSKLGESSSKTKGKDAASLGDAKGTAKRDRSLSRSPSASPPAHLLKRNRTGLPSPPQSRRRKSPRVKSFTVRAEKGEPSTPPRTTRGNRGVKQKLFPQRDSPENPFLDDVKSSDAAGSASPEAEAEETSHSPQPYVEKPTITYVLYVLQPSCCRSRLIYFAFYSRGVRTIFDNPLYDPRYPETGVPPPDAADPSKLPVEDPDFEAEAYCPPKLLFPQAHAKSRRKRRGAAVKTLDEESDAESSGSEDEGVGKGKAKAAGTSSAGTSRQAETADVVSSKGKDRHLAKKTAKKAVPSEWDTTDEEDEGGEDEAFTPPGRIPLPRDLVPAPKVIKATRRPLPKAEAVLEAETEPELGHASAELEAEVEFTASAAAGLEESEVLPSPAPVEPGTGRRIN